MARVAAIDVAVCPCCKLGRLRVVATLAGCQAFAARAWSNTQAVPPGAAVRDGLLTVCRFLQRAFRHARAGLCLSQALRRPQHWASLDVSS